MRIFGKKLIKYILELMINLLIGFLSIIVPKNKNLILLGSLSGKTFYGNPKYFFIYLTKTKHPFEYYWITRNKKIFLMLQNKGLPTLYLYSWKGFTSLIKSQYLVLTHGISDVSFSIYLPGNFYKIQTWHGTPLKKIVKYFKNPDRTLITKLFVLPAVKKDVQTYKIILSGSEEITEILSDSFENHNVKVLGYPRNDVFFNKKLLFENFYDDLQMKNYKKTILYCPTFRFYSSKTKPFSDDFLKNLNEYLKKKEYLFLIKSHINEKVEANTKNLSNIVDVTDHVEDVQELLCDIDILITDYSSVFFDYVLLDRPIVFYCYDLEQYLSESVNGMYFDYFKELPGPFVTTESELLNKIETVENWFKDSNYSKNYSAFKIKFNQFLDGQSSQRLLNYIMKIKNQV